MSQFPEEPLAAPASAGFGYFPAYPGLKLCEDRYEIVRKPGFGPRSSVWLVVDAEQGRRYIALKILTAHATRGNRELTMLKAVQRAPRDFVYNLPQLLCHFSIRSAHGWHLCMGLALLGPSFEDLRRLAPARALPVHVVQKAIAAVMEPLADLHDLGIIHNAITADNICFAVNYTTDDLDAMLAGLSPCTVEQTVVVRGVGYPVVRSQPLPHSYRWDESQMELSDLAICLSNLGHAQRVNAGGKNLPDWDKSNMDDALRPPEAILETSYDQKVDIWMIGYATYQLFTGEPLVPPEKMDDEGDQLAWILAMAGDHIDRAIAIKSPWRECFFDEQGFFEEDIPKDTLESRISASAFQEAGTFGEVRAAAKFIRDCLRLDPAERLTASRLSEHAWLKPGFTCFCGPCLESRAGLPLPPQSDA